MIFWAFADNVDEISEKLAVICVALLFITIILFSKYGLNGLNFHI